MSPSDMMIGSPWGLKEYKNNINNITQHGFTLKITDLEIDIELNQFHNL